uniref:Uncharacterized protein n=1 Tax=Arundo donax TaxID=35708 RepID=A0A0A9TS92_ARUDO
MSELLQDLIYLVSDPQSGSTPRLLHLISAEARRHGSPVEALLEELKNLKNSTEDLKQSVNKRIDGVEQSLGECFTTVKAAATSFDEWKLKVDAAVEDLKLEMGILGKHVNRVVLDHESPSPGLTTQVAAATATSSAGNSAVGPNGLPGDLYYWGKVFGLVTTLDPSPGKGKNNFNQPPLIEVASDLSCVKGSCSVGRGSFSLGSQGTNGRLPKGNFPQFDGENPRLWKSRSEDYFELYNVDPSMWIKVSTMHFTSAAARWLQSVECKIKGSSWSELCSMIHDRVVSDQHEMLIRQLFHIRQLGSV